MIFDHFRTQVTVLPVLPMKSLKDFSRINDPELANIKVALSKDPLVAWISFSPTDMLVMENIAIKSKYTYISHVTSTGESKLTHTSHTNYENLWNSISLPAWMYVNTFYIVKDLWGGQCDVAPCLYAVTSEASTYTNEDVSMCVRSLVVVLKKDEKSSLYLVWGVNVRPKSTYVMKVEVTKVKDVELGDPKSSTEVFEVLLDSGSIEILMDAVADTRFSKAPKKALNMFFKCISLSLGAVDQRFSDLERYTEYSDIFLALA